MSVTITTPRQRATIGRENAARVERGERVLTIHEVTPREDGYTIVLVSDDPTDCAFLTVSPDGRPAYL